MARTINTDGFCTQRALTTLALEYRVGESHPVKDEPPTPPGDSWSLEAMAVHANTLYFAWVRIQKTGPEKKP